MSTGAPATRYVAHVMGMRISLVLHEADRVLGTYRADSHVSPAAPK